MLLNAQRFPNFTSMAYNLAAVREEQGLPEQQVRHPSHTTIRCCDMILAAIYSLRSLSSLHLRAVAL
jgi:hypothetical protein